MSSCGWSSRGNRSWATIDRSGRNFRVYFLTDSRGIYALGYPVVTWFGRSSTWLS